MTDRRHYNAAEGFAVYRDNFNSSIERYTANKDFIDPSFRVPLEIINPEIRKDRRRNFPADGIVEFSYLWIEYDENATPPPYRITRYIGHDEEAYAMVLPYNGEVVNTFPLETTVTDPNTLDQSPINFRNNLGGTTSLDSPSTGQTFLPDSLSTGAAQTSTTWSGGTYGDWEYGINPVGFGLGAWTYRGETNSTFPESFTGSVSRQYQGHASYDWNFIYRQVANFIYVAEVGANPGRTVIEYRFFIIRASKWNGQLLTVETLVNFSGVPQTVFFDRTAINELDNDAVFQFFILAANFVWNPSLASSAPYDAENFWNNNALYTSGHTPGFPGIPNTGADDSIYNSGGTVIIPGSSILAGDYYATGTATGLVPQTHNFGINNFFLTIGAEGRGFINDVINQTQRVYPSLTGTMPGKASLYVQKQDFPPILLDEFPMNLSFNYRLTPKEDELIVTVWRETDTVYRGIRSLDGFGRFTEAELFYPSLPDPVYIEVRQYFIRNGVLDQVDLYTNPDVLPNNIWQEIQYDYSFFSGIVIGGGIGQKNSVVNSRLNASHVTDVVSYYEREFGLRLRRSGFRGGGPTYNFTNTNDTGRDYFGLNFSSAELHLGNLIDSVFYYVDVGFDDGSLCNQAIEFELSLVDVFVPRYPSMNSGWMQKLTNPDPSQRIATLNFIEGTYDGGSFTETSSGSFNGTYNLLQVSTADPNFEDIALVAVAYDPFFT